MRQTTSRALDFSGKTILVVGGSSGIGNGIAQSFRDCGAEVTVRFKPLLVQSHGAIVNLSSVAAYRSTVGNPAYSASKTGVMALTRTLGQAWAREGIRVNAIAPGLVETKLTRVTTDHPDR